MSKDFQYFFNFKTISHFNTDHVFYVKSISICPIHLKTKL